MSTKYKFYNQEYPYFVTFSVTRWIDVFTRRQYKDIPVDSINYCISKKGLIVYAWVIMSNHVHMIIGTKDKRMQDILRDMKSFTAKQLLNEIAENQQESRRDWMLWFFERDGASNPNNEKYQFWQHASHPIELFSNEVIDQKLDYIHNNPVTAGWVDEPQHYSYSSAKDYAGDKGFIEVTLML